MANVTKVVHVQVATEALQLLFLDLPGQLFLCEILVRFTGAFKTLGFPAAGEKRAYAVHPVEHSVERIPDRVMTLAKLFHEPVGPCRHVCVMITQSIRKPPLEEEVGAGDEASSHARSSEIGNARLRIFILDSVNLVPFLVVVGHELLVDVNPIAVGSLLILWEDEAEEMMLARTAALVKL